MLASVGLRRESAAHTNSPRHYYTAAEILIYR